MPAIDRSSALRLNLRPTAKEDCTLAQAASIILEDVMKANGEVGYKGRIIAPQELDAICFQACKHLSPFQQLRSLYLCGFHRRPPIDWLLQPIDK